MTHVSYLAHLTGVFTVPRDYSLLGQNANYAVETGLATADWYHTEIARKDMKSFMQRSDQPALRDTFILFTSMITLAIIAIILMPSFWSIPFWLAYGVLYGSAMDSRWHECGHGTAFKTRKYNDYIYEIASFCMIRNPIEWRWSHARHHTDTVIVGRDPEIAIMRPVRFILILLAFLGVRDALSGIRKMFGYAAGRMDPEVATFIPPQEQSKAFLSARIWITIYVSTTLVAITLGSWVPILLVGTPRLYGAWHHIMTGLLQHGGLADNVIDHRLNSRTVYMNAINRFIYWNMNYHVEHHMFPMVPYHQLPKLHEAIKNDLPVPNSSIIDAYKEVIPALWKQHKDADYFVHRALPQSARPYRIDLHEKALG